MNELRDELRSELSDVGFSQAEGSQSTHSALLRTYCDHLLACLVVSSNPRLLRSVSQADATSTHSPT